MEDIRVSQAKSVLDSISRYGPRKSNVAAQKFTSRFEKDSIESLKKRRNALQEEISKLILILSDDTIPLTSQEIMEANQEVNTLMESKTAVEKQLAKVSHGALDFPLNISTTIYFGRAKKVFEEEQKIKSISTRPRVTGEAISGDPTKDVVVKILHSEEIANKKIKLTRFDDDDEEDE